MMRLPKFKCFRDKIVNRSDLRVGRPWGDQHDNKQTCTYADISVSKNNCPPIRFRNITSDTTPARKPPRVKGRADSKSGFSNICRYWDWIMKPSTTSN